MKRNLKLPIYTLTILIILLLGYEIYKSLVFHEVSIVPPTKTLTTITPELDIYYNKALSHGVLVSSNPSAVSSFTVSGKKITIALAIPLYSTESYTIYVTNISDSSGKHLANERFSFVPLAVDSTNLPAAQSQKLLNTQTQYSQSIEGNKLIQLLPFTGPNFEYSVNYNVNYTAQGAVPIIEITGATQQDQQAALAWIKSQYPNTSSLTIQYITASP
jgi:hypothetical protein